MTWPPQQPNVHNIMCEGHAIARDALLDDEEIQTMLWVAFLDGVALVDILFQENR